MGFLVFPLLLVLTLGPTPGPPANALADFSRLSREINRQVSLVGHDGVVYEGIVAASTQDQLTMRFGSGLRTFAQTDVASAERLRDGRIDGFVKGAIFGAVLGVFYADLYDSGAEKLQAFTTSTLIYGGLGYLLDAAQTHRETIYRAPVPSPALSAKVSLRF